MAILLKQQYQLLALVVGMDISGDALRVRFALEVNQGDERVQLQEWKLPAEAVGIPQRLAASATRYQGIPFQLPLSFVADLSRLLRDNAGAEDTLWLHLAKPTGYLALVPWEQLLTHALQRPILRLPDFLVDPSDATPGALDVVLCSSQPEAKAPFRASELLVRLANLILGATARPVTLHLFTDAGAFGELTHSMRDAGLREPAVILYDPAAAPAYALPAATARVMDSAEQLVSPWLLWMRHALRERSVDMVHFVTHGYLQQDVGALAFAQSPAVNEDARLARFVGANELRAFLTQVGAWGCSLTSPFDNYSEMGLRLLAHTLATIRPGPVLHHEVRLDPDLDAIAIAYRFLLGSGSAAPPLSAALAIYCHPARVGRADGAPEAASSPMPMAKGIAYAPGREPNWYGAAMRYIDSRALDLARQKSYDAASPQSATRAEAVGSSATVRQLQEIVEETARAEAASSPAVTKSSPAAGGREQIEP